MGGDCGRLAAPWRACDVAGGGWIGCQGCGDPAGGFCGDRAGGFLKGLIFKTGRGGGILKFKIIVKNPVGGRGLKS